MRRPVATAGHVDHGKSTLVRALTGIDPDRFQEEKRRGLTIDLGFAWATLPSGRSVAFVDVPGHVRFLKNMLAGVGAVDACLFVVAATEGWKPQSEEHLRILDLLGVAAGVVALTKVGLVGADDVELAQLDVVTRTAGSFLDRAEVVAVDAVSGVGLGPLRLALDRLVSATPAPADRDRPRLWVDRSFAAPGAGTVVTGTLAGGSLRVDDDVAVVSASGVRRARVRGLQSGGEPQATLGPGSRAAMNLAGLHHEEVARGDAVVRPGQWHVSGTVDASLTVLEALGHDVSRRGAYVAYVGSGEYPVRLRVLGPALGPGASGLVRLYLPAGLPLLPGDRYVLRESGRAETIGGGEVLDVDPVRAPSKASPDRRVERVVAERGWVDADELERLTGARLAPTAGRWVVDAQALGAARTALRRAIASAGPLGLDVATLDEQGRAALDGLSATEGIAVVGGRATVGGEGDEPLARHPYLASLQRHPFDPPDPATAGVDRAELREMVRRGLVVEQDGVYFAPSALAAAAGRVAELLAGAEAGVTVAEVRTALATSRKWAVPLLARLDAEGVTRRRGDLRVAGPRLPAPAADQPARLSRGRGGQ
ncbi:MAG: selenocysteine-specific translation elongation factor [Acidimicrobiia bacterium]